MIDETAEEIADMQTHSSSAVAVKAARALRELLGREYPTVDEYVRALERNSSALRRANPSHASLHTTQHEVVDRVREREAETVTAAQEATDGIVDDVIDRVQKAKAGAASEAAPLLADGDVLLTHDYSSTVLAAVERAVADGAEFTVYVTEARPRYLGRRMVRQLGAFDGVEPRLIVDSAHGHVLDACDRVVVGMTCLVEDRLYNRVGTYPIASTAADVGVPMTTVGSSAKRVESGFSFENEHRAASEVMLEPADGFGIENPAYDATPLELLETVVTDQGTHRPGE